MSRVSTFYNSLTHAQQFAACVAVVAIGSALGLLLITIASSYVEDWFAGRERRRAERRERERLRAQRKEIASDIARRVWLRTPVTDAELHRMMERYQYDRRREQQQHPSQQPDERSEP